MDGWAEKRAKTEQRIKEFRKERKKERNTKDRPPNKFDGIQLSEYRIFATVPFIDKTFMNITKPFINREEKKLPDLWSNH